MVLPALAAHVVTELGIVGRLAVGVVAFSLVASSAYLVNDVRDVEMDRRHPVRRNRPVAAGDLTVRAALVGAVGLATLGLVTARWLDARFAVVVAVYLSLTLSYTLVLRRVVVLDVVALAVLYAVRLVGGAVLVDVALSRWFLAFSVFLFGSLALAKRVGGLREENKGLEADRGYQLDDQPVLVALGAAFAVASALVYSLYITGDDVTKLYTRPDWLWAGLPVLLYWLARLWLLAGRGRVREDPVAFALRDRVSYATLAAFLAVVWLAR